MHLGIDLGTSAVKVCLLDPAGDVAATASAALDVSHPFDGASEQDCNAWWQATCKAIGTLDPALRARVRAIGLSGQMHGAVLLDADHAPVRPVILWNDARATAECADMLAAAPDAGEIAGAPPMAGFTAPKLLWLSRHEPEVHARIGTVLLPKDYIGFRLHGRFVTDPSDAAGTSWYDEAARRWSDRLCRASATDPAWLPEVRHGTEVAGELLPVPAGDLGLPAGIPVATGGGDAAAGAVGIGAVSAGDGFISLGTSGQLFITTPDYRPNLASRIHAYAHTVPGHWFQMAAMLNGARPIAWLAELLRRPIAELLEEAEAAPQGPLFLPYLTGERTPHGDTDIRAGFYGLGETTTQGSLMRSVVEAVAFTFADAVDALSEAGTMPDTLLAIGGGTRSDFLLQTIVDVTGCRLGRTEGADIGPALGADGSPAEVMTKPPVARWFEPASVDAERPDGELRPRCTRVPSRRRRLRPEARSRSSSETAPSRAAKVRVATTSAPRSRTMRTMIRTETSALSPSGPARPGNRRSRSGWRNRHRGPAGGGRHTEGGGLVERAQHQRLEHDGAGSLHRTSGRYCACKAHRLDHDPVRRSAPPAVGSSTMMSRAWGRPLPHGQVGGRLQHDDVKRRGRVAQRRDRAAGGQRRDRGSRRPTCEGILRCSPDPHRLNSGTSRSSRNWVGLRSICRVNCPRLAMSDRVSCASRAIIGKACGRELLHAGGGGATSPCRLGEMPRPRGTGGPDIGGDHRQVVGDRRDGRVQPLDAVAEVLHQRRDLVVDQRIRPGQRAFGGDERALPGLQRAVDRGQRFVGVGEGLRHLPPASSSARPRHRRHLRWPSSGRCRRCRSRRWRGHGRADIGDHDRQVGFRRLGDDARWPAWRRRRPPATPPEAARLPPRSACRSAPPPLRRRWRSYRACARSVLARSSVISASRRRSVAVEPVSSNVAISAAASVPQRASSARNFGRCGLQARWSSR
jgi:xylulokinase